MDIFSPTDIPEVIKIRPKVFSDSRGFFMETFRLDVLSESGICHEFVQDNHSSSIQWTLRGLHYQMKHTQGKLVRVVIGEIFDVAVDLRKSSAHFGKWVGVYLSAENKEQLWIPPGFAHGFLVLTERADVVYKATDYYHPESDRTILWNDSSLSINWPIPEGVQPIISNKDAAGQHLREAEVFE
jgi:dTDP-4-dehydrorhamnose 3,5-epimerase